MGHLQKQSEKLITEAYKNVNYQQNIPVRSKQDFLDFYRKYRSIFFENCKLQPAEIVGRKQMYRYNSGPNYVLGDILYCSIVASKDVLNEVGSKKVPFVEDHKLNFDHFTLTYKLPGEQIQSIEYVN